MIELVTLFVLLQTHSRTEDNRHHNMQKCDSMHLFNNYCFRTSNHARRRAECGSHATPLYLTGLYQTEQVSMVLNVHRNSDEEKGEGVWRWGKREIIIIGTEGMERGGGKAREII